MDEYIRREDAIKCIEDQCVDGKMWGNDENDEWTLIEAYSAIDDLMEIPPADVAPVRHGRWIYHPDDLFPGDSTQECSCCHEEEYLTLYNENYCPNCGAKMDGGAD